MESLNRLLVRAQQYEKNIMKPMYVDLTVTPAGQQRIFVDEDTCYTIVDEAGDDERGTQCDRSAAGLLLH